MHVLMKYQKDLFLKNGLLYQKGLLKNHQEPVVQFVLPHNFEHKVILACHDDDGHLGMERTLGLLQERFFWPKMVDDMHVHIRICDQCTRFNQPQERTGIKPILVCYLLELIHLDFLTLGGKADNNWGVSIF